METNLDLYKFGPYYGRITRIGSVYYWQYTSSTDPDQDPEPASNGIFFKRFLPKKNKYTIQQGALGYTNSNGDFPACRSAGDVIKLIIYAVSMAIREGTYTAADEINSLQSDSMHIITTDDAMRIINMACNNWAKKLADMWGSDIVLKKDIKVTKEFRNEMFAAATNDQLPVLESIFPFVDFKPGEIIAVKKDGHYVIAKFIQQASSKLLVDIMLNHVGQPYYRHDVDPTLCCKLNSFK